jgi:saccharopine dehydrogenase (NAD+, L-lysine-forming)
LVRETTTTTIIIAGRDGDRAKQVALQLGLQYNCPNRIRWRRVDVTDTNSLDEAFSMISKQQDNDNVGVVAAAAAVPAAVNMVVVASSTTSCAKQVAEAALRHHVNYYFDIQLSSKSKIQDLTALEAQIRAANTCFVTDGGVHPGVPGALVRYAQAMANNDSTTTMAVLSANVYLLFRPNWKQYKFSPATQKEFIQEMCQMPPMLYRNGAWVDTGWTCTPTFDFGPPFGKQMCMPMYLQEMKNIAEDNQQMMMMQEMGVYVSGDIGFFHLSQTSSGLVGSLAGRALSMEPNNIFQTSVWRQDCHGSRDGFYQIPATTAIAK